MARYTLLIDSNGNIISDGKTVRFVDILLSNGYAIRNAENQLLLDLPDDPHIFSNILVKNNNTPFTPDGNYNPATKIYVDQQVSEAAASSNQILVSTDKVRLLISNGEAVLPSKAIGDIVYGMAYVYDYQFDKNNLDSLIIDKLVSVDVSEDGTKIIFDSGNDVDGKYCVVSYLTYKINT